MEMISDLNQPCLAIGDFNAITSAEEKIGGKSPNRSSMMDFNNCLDTCELIQAPSTGLQHFWSNCQHGNKKILCKLDIAIFNLLWLQKFEGWSYKVVLRVASDHAPLLGGGAQIPKPQNAPMRFQKMWVSHPNFMEVVQKCWSEEIIGDPAFILQRKLKKLKKILKDWNWNVFWNINVQVKEAEVKVQETMVNSDNNPFDEAFLNTLVEAQNLYNSKEVQLNTFLKQKSRTKWIKEGAANSSFLHAQLKIRQARNMIIELEDGKGNIIVDQKQIQNELVKHFENKFKYKEVENVDHMLRGIP
ncbi:uncharacterized protein LOC113313050 [Papaver somniferum]|uniref:uncharacterized protein LOC113313050 n=1 Tax=Papaver somniferum TaxID=3469 RepID=UPI000E702607|nr:uncharacterized protein LOC113313050 [Papaver somniferum]